MEVKEGEVLSREGKPVYTPEGAQRSARQVIFRYQKMGTLAKILAAPAFLLALGIVLFLVAIVGFFLFISFVKRGFSIKKR
jgi:hypothetical protein